MAAFGGNVFADVAPAGSNPPMTVVRMNGVQRVESGVSTWDGVVLLLDVVGSSPELSVHDLAGMVRDRVESLAGRVVGGVVFQSVEAVNGVFGFDPTFTPAVPRWVLSASLVVRDI